MELPRIQPQPGRIPKPPLHPSDERYVTSFNPVVFTARLEELGEQPYGYIPPEHFLGFPVFPTIMVWERLLTEIRATGKLARNIRENQPDSPEPGNLMGVQAAQLNLAKAVVESVMDSEEKAWLLLDLQDLARQGEVELEIEVEPLA